MVPPEFVKDKPRVTVPPFAAVPEPTERPICCEAAGLTNTAAVSQRPVPIPTVLDRYSSIRENFSLIDINSPGPKSLGRIFHPTITEVFSLATYTVRPNGHNSHW